MINKEYLNKINPKQEVYDSKYSEETYKFLNKNKTKDIKVYWHKKSLIGLIDGSYTAFNPDEIELHPTQIYFIYKSQGDWLGISWIEIMSNNYKVLDYSDCDRTDYIDVTEWFYKKYLEIGRCIFDKKHYNFLLGENYNYVKEEERFDVIDGIKKCRWCDKIIN